jgi:hypothetical protein
MRKICFLQLIFITIATSAGAQRGWGITAGSNLSKMKETEELLGSDQRPYKISPVIKFQAGIYKEIKATENIVITPSLLFIKKGYKSSKQDILGGQDRERRYDFHPSYLQLPIDVVYRAKLNDKRAFDIGIGVYGAYGLGGKGHQEIKLDGKTVIDNSFDLVFLNKTKVTYENGGVTTNAGYSRPLDIGGGIVLNYIFMDNLGLKLNADHSFFNLYSKYSNGDKPVAKKYNQQLRLSLNYIL